MDVLKTTWVVLIMNECSISAIAYNLVQSAMLASARQQGVVTKPRYKYHK